MKEELGFQIFILLVSLIVLIRGIMKLPRKVAVVIIVWLVVSTILITLACVYYPETVISVFDFFGVDVGIGL